MGRGQVPDVSRPETRLWFYYQAASYIDAGCEGIHFGQVEIMNRNDHSRDTRETGSIRLRSPSRSTSPKGMHRIDPDQDTVGGVWMHVAPSCTGHQGEDVESATRKGIGFGIRVWGLQHQCEQPFPAPRKKFLETVAKRRVWVSG